MFIFFFPERKGQSIVRRRMAYTILLVYILLSVLILGVVSCERGLRLEGCYSLVEDFRLDDTIQLFSLGERIYLERFEQFFLLTSLDKWRKNKKVTGHENIRRRLNSQTADTVIRKT